MAGAAAIPLSANHIMKRNERTKIRDAYGQKIKVAGSDMRVDIQG